MELKSIIITLSENYLKLLIYAGMGAAVGLAIYYLIPHKHFASGSLHIAHTVESGGGRYFTYEGYYGQQTSQMYTATVLGILESTDLRAKTLKSLSKGINEITLRRLKKMVRVKKAAPGVITVSVKADTSQEAQRIWKVYIEEGIVATQLLNIEGDPNLQVSPMSTAPVVEKQYRSPYVDGFGGLVLGFFVGVFVVATEKYLVSIGVGVGHVSVRARGKRK